MIVNSLYSIPDFETKKELVSLPPSSKFILYLLKQRGALTQQEILDKTLLPKRTIAYSVKKLREKNFIKRYKDKADKRISIFEAII